MTQCLSLREAKFVNTYALPSPMINFEEEEEEEEEEDEEEEEEEEEEEKYEFYEDPHSLQDTVSKVTSWLLLVALDCNGRVGINHAAWNGAPRPDGTGGCSVNGLLLL
ncbi:hypothetical protein SprV_0401562400 [Sparganum proliferum]